MLKEKERVERSRVCGINEQASAYASAEGVRAGGGRGSADGLVRQQCTDRFSTSLTTAEKLGLYKGAVPTRSWKPGKV